MRWSFRIFTVAGIGIYLHITFLILILFVFSMYFGKGGAALAIHGTGLIAAVFGCVLLHELGHALTAKRFGVRTKDIVLLPIGGMARLERIPREPWHEFSITVAGPLVNLLIAGGLYLVLCLLQLPAGLHLDDFTTPRSGSETFLRQLLEINIALVIFNLIPAFPMDGGRILRSLLALVMDHSRATWIAASVGQTLAILFGFYGIMYGHVILLLIAVFVFLGASGEASSARLQAVFRGLPASAAMITRFATLRPDDTLGAAVDRLLSGSQADFPIMAEGEVLGVLTRRQLVSNLRSRGPGCKLRDIALTRVNAVDAAAPLFQAWEELARQGTGCLPLEREGQIVGWITSNNLAEVAMVREALARVAGTPPGISGREDPGAGQERLPPLEGSDPDARESGL